MLDELFGVGMRAGRRRLDRPADPAIPCSAPLSRPRRRNDSVEAVAAAIGLPIAEVRAALGRLEVDGYLVRRDLGGWERTAR